MNGTQNTALQFIAMSERERNNLRIERLIAMLHQSNTVLLGMGQYIAATDENREVLVEVIASNQEVLNQELDSQHFAEIKIIARTVGASNRQRDHLRVDRLVAMLKQSNELLIGMGQYVVDTDPNRAVLTHVIQCNAVVLEQEHASQHDAESRIITHIG